MRAASILGLVFSLSALSLPAAPDPAVTWYAVPALSPVKRLPDTAPADGTLRGDLRIVAARDEFEPASLVLTAVNDVPKMEIKTGDLTGPAGVIPASCVDVKVVKCWYQSGTAWYSYFADNAGRVLVPELLLNDETLVRVDPATKDNYLRADDPAGPRELWISYPSTIAIPFNAELTPVADAPALRPFSLEAGRFKQIWITVKIPKDAAPGVYRGGLKLTAAGAALSEVPLVVRVLPFQLPVPMTYYDLGREFYTMLYNEPQYGEILKKNGGDRAHADRKMLALYRNMRDHNIRHPLLHRDFKPGSTELYIRQLELFRDAGLSTDPLFGAVPGIPPYGWMTSVVDVAIFNQVLPPDLVSNIDQSASIVAALFGHSNVYCFGWDEPSRRLVVAERKPWTYIHDKGLKIYSTGKDDHFNFAGYNEDFINIPGDVTRERSDRWHAVGQRISNYAGPHTGPENPDFNRRIHGLPLYKAGYDAIGNYILTASGWNDFLGDSYNFRGFNLTYPTREGVIDTIQWEGIREGVDDIRYATLLKQMAATAIESGKTPAVYAGRQALRWLEATDEKSADLDAVRLEMIGFILRLREFADYPRVATKTPPEPKIRSQVPGVAAAAPAPTPDDLIATNRLLMAKTSTPARSYRKCAFAILDILVGQKRVDDLKEAAAELGGDAKLAPQDRYQARLVAAVLGAGPDPAAMKRESVKAGESFTGEELNADGRVAAVYEAGKLFMTLARYPEARALLEVAAGMYRPEPAKTAPCRFVERAPASVEGWAASGLLKDPGAKESRYEPYDRKAAAMLVNDVNTARDAESAAGTNGTGAAFAMAWDTDGWHLYVECPDGEMDKVDAGLLSGGRLEMFFAPGLGTLYYQWFMGYPQVDFKSVSYDSPNRQFREMEPFVKADAGRAPGGFATSLVIAWELVYDKLPADGAAWPFNAIRWSRAGGTTWRGKVHNIHSFGTVRFEGVTPDRLLEIKRKILMRGLARYRKAKAEQAALWKDEVLGDPAFYRERLLPAIAALDAEAAKVEGPLAPAEVSDLYARILPDWMNFGNKTAELRRDWLLGKMMN